MLASLLVRLSIQMSALSQPHVSDVNCLWKIFRATSRACGGAVGNGEANAIPACAIICFGGLVS